MLRVWNVVLIALTFSLTLFGTFLTRSGVVNSIHSFSQSSIGGWFLALSRSSPSRRSLILPGSRSCARGASSSKSLRLARSGVPLQQPAAGRLCIGPCFEVAVPSSRRRARRPVEVGAPFYDFLLRAFGWPCLC